MLRSDSISIAVAVTKARPGGASSRADEWRNPRVRSDPKLGVNDLVMARPRPTACLTVCNRTVTLARERGSCEGRRCRKRMSMGTRMRRGWEGARGTDLRAANQEVSQPACPRSSIIDWRLLRQWFSPVLFNIEASRPDHMRLGTASGTCQLTHAIIQIVQLSPKGWHAGGCL